MNLFSTVLKNDERAIYELRSLYKQYGYSLYKVSKFEEYDLYAENKNFLINQNVLTFTDTNGKLLALKPDVTLSIIKNIPADSSLTQKLCYNETVYRPSSESGGFREIMQTGLECIGTIDLYAECEVILLAMKSLATVSKDYILDLSHMGITEGILETLGVDGNVKEEFLHLMKGKNVQGLKKLCEKHRISSSIQTNLCSLIDLYLPIQRALLVLQEFMVGEKMQTAYENLTRISQFFSENGLDEHIYLDFSMISDVNYYDGITFKGCINGIPESVLSGGRYDKLLHRLGKKSDAIGFAVYLDRLERFEYQAAQYDVDTILLYEKETDIQSVFQKQRQMQANGKSVFATLNLDPSLRYRQLIQFTNGGIQILETND